MIVVSDTSPLNYLILIEQADLLHKLFDRVIIPQAVAAELTDAAAPVAVRQFIEAPAAWLSIVQPRGTDRALSRLGRGEVEAISLASEMQADLLMCDDRAARHAASLRNIRVIGTLGVLELAATKKLIDLPSCLEQLRRTTMRLPDELVARMLRDDATRKPIGE